MTSVGAVSIELSLDRSKFDSDLRSLESLQPKSLSSNLDVKLNTTSLQRQIRDLKNGDYGTISITLTPDINSLERKLRNLPKSIPAIDVEVSPDIKGFQKKLKALSSTLSVQIEAKANLTSFNRQIDSIAATKRSFTIDVKVDHRPLHALNEHLDLKRRHFNEIQRHFDKHPLTVKTDISQIGTAIVALNQLQAKVADLNSSINAQIQTSIQYKIDASGLENAINRASSSFIKAGDEVGDKIARRIERSRPSGNSGIFGSLMGGLGSLLSGPFRAFRNAASMTSAGFFMETGASFARSTTSRPTREAGKKAAQYTEAISKYVIGLEDYLSVFLSELTRTGNFQGASAAAAPRMKIAQTLQQFQKMVTVATMPQEGYLGKLEESAPDLAALVRKNMGGKEGATALKKGIAATLEELRPKEFVDNLINPLLSDMEGITRFIAKMQAYRTVVAAQNRKNQILPTFPLMNEGQQGIVNVIGGAMFMGGEGGRKIAPALEALLPERKLLPVQNPDTDRPWSGSSRPLDPRDTFVVNLLKKIAPGIGTNPDFYNTIVNATKQVTAAFDPTFVSQGAVQSLANILAAKEMGVPEEKIGTVSYSLGGAEGVRLATAQNMAGLTKSPVLSMAYPFLNIAKLNNPNYQSSLLEADPLSFPFLLGVGGKRSEQMKLYSGVSASGYEAHAYKHLFRSPEFVKDFFGTLNHTMSEVEKGLEKFVHNSSSFYELLGSVEQAKSLLSTGDFNLKSAFKGFIGKEGATGLEVITKVAESAASLKDTGNLPPTAQAVSSSISRAVAPVLESIVKQLRASGASLPEKATAQDIYGYLKLQSEARGVNEAIAAFKTGQKPAQGSGYFAGELNPEIVSQRLRSFDEAIAYFKKAPLGQYKDSIVNVFENLKKVAIEFAKTGKVSEQTLSTLQYIQTETLTGDFASLMQKTMKPFDLPSQEVGRRLQVDVPEWVYKTPASILAYNKMLSDMGSKGDFIPFIRDFERAAYGMSGAATLLTKDLAYKTDIADPTKIASKQEVAAYQKLAGRFAPLMYKGEPGKILVTERIQGTPMKDMLDALAQPAISSREQIRALTSEIRKTEDANSRQDLVAKLRQARTEYRAAREKFNAEAEAMYVQVGQLGKTLQSMGVAHMDLASANVFFTPQGIKAIDLGNAVVNPTRGQKLMDEMTAIQRAAIDRQFWGILDPLRAANAIRKGYSGPSLPLPMQRTADPGMLPYVPSPDKAIPLGSQEQSLLETALGDYRAAAKQAEMQKLLAAQKQQFLQSLEQLQPIVKSFDKASTGLKSLDPEQAKVLASTIINNFERAIAEINSALDSMPKEARMSTREGNQLANLKSRIVKAKNKAERIVGTLADPIEQPAPQQALVQSDLGVAGISVGTNVTLGMTKGITGNIQEVKTAGQLLGETVIKAAEGELEIKSPSRRFIRIGKFIVEGLKKGLEGLRDVLGTQVADQVSEGIKETSRSASSALKQSIQTIDVVATAVKENVVPKTPPETPLARAQRLIKEAQIRAKYAIWDEPLAAPMGDNRPMPPLPKFPLALPPVGGAWTMPDLWKQPSEPIARVTTLSPVPPLPKFPLALPPVGGAWTMPDLWKLPLDGQTTLSARPPVSPRLPLALPPARPEFWQIPDFWAEQAAPTARSSAATRTTAPQRQLPALPAVANSTLNQMIHKATAEAKQALAAAEKEAASLMQKAIAQVMQTMAAGEAAARELAIFSESEANSLRREVGRAVQSELSRVSSNARATLHSSVSASVQALVQALGSVSQQLTSQQLREIKTFQLLLQQIVQTSLNSASLSIPAYLKTAPKPLPPSSRYWDTQPDPWASYVPPRLSSSAPPADPWMATPPPIKPSRPALPSSVMTIDVKVETVAETVTQVQAAVNKGIAKAQNATQGQRKISLAELSDYYAGLTGISLTIKEIIELAKHLNIPIEKIYNASYIDASNRDSLDQHVLNSSPNRATQVNKPPSSPTPKPTSPTPSTPPTPPSPKPQSWNFPLSPPVNLLQNRETAPNSPRESDRFVGVRNFLQGWGSGMSAENSVADDIGKIFGSVKDQLKEANPELFKFVNLAGSLFKGFIAFQGFFLLQNALRQISSDAFKAYVEMDKLKTTLNFSSGGAIAGAKNLEFVRKTVEDLKIPLLAAEQGFTKLQSAVRNTPLERATRDIFKGNASAATVLSLSPEETSSIFLAQEQIASKGKVQAQELRLQLGNALPGAFQIAARAMGVTEAQLNKLLETGQLISEDFLPRFGKQLQLEFGEAAKDASNNAASSVYGLQNSFLELQRSIGSAIGPATVAGLNTLSFILKGVTSVMDEVMLAVSALSIALLIKLGVALKETITTLILTKATGATLGGAFSDVARFINNSATVQITAGIFAALAAVKLLYDTVNTDLVKSFDNAARAAERAAKASREALNPKPQRNNSNDLPDVNWLDTATKWYSKQNPLVKFLVSPAAMLGEGIGRGATFLKTGKSDYYTYGELQRDNLINGISDFSFSSNQFLGSASTQLASLKSQGGLGVIEDQIKKTESDRRVLQADIDRKFTRKGLLVPPEYQKQVEDLTLKIEQLNDQKVKLSSPVTLDLQRVNNQIAAAKTKLRELEDPNVIAALGGEEEASRQKQQLQSTLEALRKFKFDAEQALASLKLDPVTSFTTAMRRLNVELAKNSEALQLQRERNKSGILEKQISGFSTNRLASKQATLADAIDERDNLKSSLVKLEANLKQQQAQVSEPALSATLKRLGVKPTFSAAEIQGVIDNPLTDDADKPILQQLKAVKELEFKLAQTRNSFNSSSLRVQQTTQQNSLDEMTRAAAVSTATIQQAENEKIAAVRKAVASRKLTEIQATEQISDIQLDSTRRNIKNIGDQLITLREYHKQGKISAESFDSRERELLTSSSALKKQLAEQELASANAVRARILENLELTNKVAAAAITKSQNASTQFFKSGQLKSPFTQESDRAFESAQTEVQLEATKKRIEDVLRRLKELEGNKSLFTQNEYTQKRIDLETELGNLQTSRLDQQLALERRNYEEIIRQEKRKVELETASLDRTKQLLESRRSLAKALSDADVAQGESSVQILDKALEIRKQLDGATNPNTRRQLSSALGSLGVGSDELSILNRKQQLEDDIAQKKLAALQQEQQFTRQILEVDLKRQRLAAQMAVYEADIANQKALIATLEASKQVEDARKTGDERAIANAQKLLDINQKILGITAKQVENARANLASADEVAANSRARLDAEQKTARVQAVASERLRNVTQDTTRAQTYEGRNSTSGSSSAANSSESGIADSSAKKQKTPNLFEQSRAKMFAPPETFVGTYLPPDQSGSIGLNKATSVESDSKRYLGLDPFESAESYQKRSLGLNPKESAESYFKRSRSGFLGGETSSSYDSLNLKYRPGASTLSELQRQHKPIAKDFEELQQKYPATTSGFTSFTDSLREANKSIEAKLDTLNQTMAAAVAAPRQLYVSSSTPVSDAAQIYSNIARGMTTAAGLG